MLHPNPKTPPRRPVPQSTPVAQVEVPEAQPERRRSPIRRDINQMFRSPDGRLSEAKIFAVIFKCPLLWVFIYKIDTILHDWSVLLLFICAFLAPDVLKKLIAMRIPTSQGKP